MHTTLKNVELLKHFKISNIAPTCFGLQGNHHQGDTESTYLKLHTWLKVDTLSSYKTLSVLWLHVRRVYRALCEGILCTVHCVRVYCVPCTVRVYPHTVHGTHASQVTICSHNTDNVLYGLYLSTFNHVCNF